MESARTNAIASLLGGLATIAAAAPPPGSDADVPVWRVVLIVVGVVATAAGTVGLLGSFTGVRNVARNVREGARARRRRRARRRWRCAHGPAMLTAVNKREPTVALYLDPPDRIRGDVGPGGHTLEVRCLVRSSGRVWVTSVDDLPARVCCGLAVAFPQDFTPVAHHDAPPSDTRYAVIWLIVWNGRSLACGDSFHVDRYGQPVPGPLRRRWRDSRDQMRRLWQDDRDDEALFR